MAYQSSSSRTSSSRGSYSRGGGGGGGGGGGQNMTAYAVAAVLVVLVIVIFMVMSGKKKEPAPSVPTSPPPKAAPVAAPGPTKAAEKPYPPVAQSLLQKGKDLVSTFEKNSLKASELYKESLKAKEAKDDKLWQSKLTEARTLLDNINDQWNDYIATLPHTEYYSTDDVATHYLPSESGRVQRFVKLLASMKSDQK